MEKSDSNSRESEHRNTGEYTKDQKKLHAVLEKSPKDKESLFNLAVVYDQLNNTKEAEKYYRLLLAEYPSDLTTLKNLAALLFDQGKSTEAHALYEQIIHQNPHDIDAHYAYSKTGKYSREDQALHALELATDKAASLPADKKIKLCFTLGKANQDLGEYKAAFGAFQTGGELHYQASPFDEHNHFNMMDDIQSCFNQDYINQMISSQVEDSVPVFVLGMPRSGSTLIEQILASHKAVTGAGELKYLKQSIQTHLIGYKGTVSNAINDWDQQTLEKTANDYLEKLHQHAGPRQDGKPGQRIVDKMPGSFVFIGIIRQLFPNAKIIHSARHPMATIWSNFSTLFKEDALNFTYRLDVLTRYYQKYQQLMHHWNSCLPKGSIYNLEYERLVQNPEHEVRELLKYLELPWDPNCMNFHNNKRQVKTASIMQVRQPLYNSSIELWKNYQTELTPVNNFLNG